MPLWWGWITSLSGWQQAVVCSLLLTEVSVNRVFGPIDSRSFGNISDYIRYYIISGMSLEPSIVRNNNASWFTYDVLWRKMRSVFVFCPISSRIIGNLGWFSATFTTQLFNLCILRCKDLSNGILILKQVAVFTRKFDGAKVSASFDPLR